MSMNPSRQTSRIAMAAVGLLALYLLTANYSAPYGVDAFTNAAQARAFADDQDPILEEFDGFQSEEFRGSLAWFVDSPDGVTSQYPPGAAAWATPFYLFDSSYEIETFTNANPVGDPERGADGAESEEEADLIEVDVPIPSFVPASVAAALSVAIAMAFFGWTLLNVMPMKPALLSMATAALGTGAWSVASDKLWQHGPAMMCISVGTYLASINRFAASGLVFGAGVLVRPHTAVVAACIGLAIAVSRRSLKEISILGAFSSLGLVVLLMYNKAIFGSASVSGGYGGSFGDRLANDSPFTLVGRLAGSLVHLDVGMIWSSPFLVLAIFAMWKSRGSAPDWAVGAAIGGFVYLVIQYRANRLTGGGGFYSYRYPLEALMAAGPILAISTWTWLKDDGRRQRIFAVLAVLSILSHGAGSLQ
jgi:hypothetical protein